MLWDSLKTHQGTLRGGSVWLLKRLLKIYSPESFTSVRSVKTPDTRYIWEGDHPKGIKSGWEKRLFPHCFPGRVRHFSIDEQILKWLQRLELIDSYNLRPVSNTGRDYEFLVKQYKGGPEVPTNRCGFWCFSSPASANPLLLC